MNTGPEFAREQAHLDGVLAVVREQLLKALQSGEARYDELVLARQELNEQTEQMFRNLNSAQGFEELANLNQLAQPLFVDQRLSEMGLKHIEALRRMADAPYFARIDLKYEEGDTEKTYIGRAALRSGASGEILVTDWRAPVASVFYRYGVGSARYDAPAGTVGCEVLLKRQYEIVRGALKYCFDADVEVQDEFLRSLLSRNASPQMKAIVETIQREQDSAIRDMEHDLLMVQGAAGSGKTSIALHRVAYLMFEGLASRLSEKNILILSPNALFERYIENVLPELGEKSVDSVTLERLLEARLGGRVETRIDRFEALCLADRERRGLLRAACAFKGSRDFLKILDRFIEALPRRVIAFEDVYYAGRVIATREGLRARASRRGGKLPLGVELVRMEKALWTAVHERRAERLDALRDWARTLPWHVLEVDAFARACSILECRALARRIRRFTCLDARALYRLLMSDAGAFGRLARGLNLPDGLDGMLEDTRAALDKDRLTLEDASAIAYLDIRLMGAGSMYPDIRQLVIDEAQDVSELQFALMNLIFPRARLTVLGDVHQAIDREADMSHYESIRRALPRPRSALVTLDKSFRCTREILRFACRFLGPDVRIESFNRTGEAPRVTGAKSRAELEREIARTVERLRQTGCGSIALITKTEHDARDWHARLFAIPDLRLIEGYEAARGAFVIPLALSKGLEFDAVLVLDADDAHYAQPEDKQLLYVASTRALHDLSVFYEGAPSPFLPLPKEVQP